MADQRGQVPIQQPAERPSTAADSEKYNSSGANTHREEATHQDTVSKEDREFYEKFGTYDRYEITEEDCYEELGFCFPTWKKARFFPPPRMHIEERSNTEFPVDDP